ncbi:hypothetical protein B0T09DRAFT_318890 [Sordaria sp. MPI-SDFR-AT-0083]|nr:hypothetical protein B0T09DRAFT_318890 [Sordaria sp. MPI-SDFR-AT-0083]
MMRNAYGVLECQIYILGNRWVESFLDYVEARSVGDAGIDRYVCGRWLGFDGTEMAGRSSTRSNGDRDDQTIRRRSEKAWAGGQAGNERRRTGRKHGRGRGQEGKHYLPKTVLLHILSRPSSSFPLGSCHVAFVSSLVSLGMEWPLGSRSFSSRQRVWWEPPTQFRRSCHSLKAARKVPILHARPTGPGCSIQSPVAHAHPTLRATVPDGRCSAFHALGRCHSPVLVVLRAAAVQFISANKDIQKNGLDLAFRPDAGVQEWKGRPGVQCSAHVDPTTTAALHYYF